MTRAIIKAVLAAAFVLMGTGGWMLLSTNQSVPVTLTVSLSPATLMLADNSITGTFLSNVAVSVSGGGAFTGNVGFGAPYGNGNGDCTLTGSGSSYILTLGPGGPVIYPGQGGSVSSAEGTFTFGALSYGSEYAVLLNGMDANSASDRLEVVRGVVYEFLTYNGHWYQRIPSWGWADIGTTAPFPLPSGTSTQKCTVTATQ